jgi:hypothetical protein
MICSQAMATDERVRASGGEEEDVHWVIGFFEFLSDAVNKPLKYN